MNSNMNIIFFMNININYLNNMNNMNINNNIDDGVYIEVEFDGSTGKKEKIKISKNISIRKLIKIYCKKVGISKDACEKKI